MSVAGCTGPAPTEGNGVAAITTNLRDPQKTQTELETEAGRKAQERRAQRIFGVAPKKPTDPAPVGGWPLSSGKTADSGIVAAVTANPAQAEGIKREIQPSEQPGPKAGHAKKSDNSAALDFLDDFFGSNKRHLVAIKKPSSEGTRSIITACHFDAVDRAGQQKFITECSAAGFDLYFSPNPIKGTFHKKATKNDVAEARYLWIDLDPRGDEPLEVQRTAMLKLLTTDLPQAIPRPNRVIDSGRGYWGFWKLATPRPVDGRRNNVNGPLTEDVECYGRGIERAFGDRFADGCRNIDRVARLPGTINHKTGRLACVLHKFSHDEPHAVENFPRGDAEKRKDQGPKGKKPSDEYEPVFRDAPELAKLDVAWVIRIFEGDTDGKYQNDRSRLAFAVACELVRVGLDDKFIARVLMTTPCGVHVQESPAYRLNRTIRRAHEFAIDPDLEEMNSQHAVLPIGDKTRVVTWGDDHEFPGRKTIVRAQTFEDFKNLHSNKRKHVETGKIGDDGKPITKSIPLGAWWLSQERRRQYDGGQRFMPQYEAEVVGNVLNMFQGLPIQPRKPDGRSGASGCQLFLDHGLKIMCSGNEEHWDYLLKREAWIAQNRRRSEIAAAYRTEAEGSGKGFWCNHLGRLYGPHFMQVSNPAHVIGKHNPHLETLLKLCADEALFVGDPRHRNALFSLITEPHLTVEPKFINAYSAPNYLNIDIVSNAKHFVPASRTARRLFIPTVSENRVGDLEYFETIAKQLQDGGYEALLYHLLYEVDLRDFDVRRVPKTAGLTEQVEYSRKGVDGLVEKICNDGCVPCAYPQWPGFSVSNGYEMKAGFDYFIDNHTDRELRDLGALKVKRDLRRNWLCKSGDDAKRRDGSNMIYGVKWPPLQELRELFVNRHGPQDWLHPEATQWPMLTSTTFYDTYTT